jgi:hypothetical protein
VNLKESAHRLRTMIEQLEQDGALYEPDRLRMRLEALDHLDSWLMDGQLNPSAEPAFDADLEARARLLCSRLESANAGLYNTIRKEIQMGAGTRALLKIVPSSWSAGHKDQSSPTGEGYDYLDELIGGIFQFETPDVARVQLTPEMVRYQPTPARHILDLIRRTALAERDVFIDLGSGLGKVPLLVSICTGARSIGIELDGAYVECARQCAEGLNLKNAIFLHQDARTAVLSRGTVFYLYTPFTGSILRTVLDRLQQEACNRSIRVCAYGPCVSTIAEEPWLLTLDHLRPDRIVIFTSRD